MRKFGLVITLLSQLLVGLIQFSIYTISRMKRIKRIINKYNWHFLMFSYSKDEINQINFYFDCDAKYLHIVKQEMEKHYFKFIPFIFIS